MKHIRLLVIAVALACNTGNSGKDNNAEKRLNEESLSAVKTADECKQTVKNFLTWYKQHFEDINAIYLIESKEDSDRSEYRVNFKNVARFLSVLEKSGYFSDSYLKNQMRYYKERDSAFVKEKQNDGPPAGMDSDPFLYTQDVESVFEKLDSLEVYALDSNSLRLISVDNNLLFNVEFKNGSCLITEILFEKK